MTTMNMVKAVVTVVTVAAIYSVLSMHKTGGYVLVWVLFCPGHSAIKGQVLIARVLTQAHDIPVPVGTEAEDGWVSGVGLGLCFWSLLVHWQRERRARWQIRSTEVTPSYARPQRGEVRSAAEGTKGAGAERCRGADGWHWVGPTSSEFLFCR